MSRYSLKKLLTETYIGRESFEALVDSFAEQGYTYYPYDKNTDPTKISIFLSLEQEAGDNVKAFTFVPQRKGSGDVTGIGIFAMPGERYYFFDDANEEDLELLAGAGQLNEYDINWDEGISFNSDTSAEDVADRLANIGAKYVELTTDVEPEPEYGQTDRDYLDKMAQLFSEKYGDEKEIYFTYSVDDDTFIFSDSTYWYDEDGFLSDDVELIIGAGQLNENRGAWDDGIQWGLDNDVEDAADTLAEMGAKFIEYDYDIDDVNQYSADTAFESIALMMEKEYSDDDTLYYAYEDYYDGNERKKAFVFSDGEYVDATFWSDDEIELFRGAGQLNEDSPLGKAWWRDVDWTADYKAESLADVLAEMGAEYVPAEDIDLPNKENYDGDINGYAQDSAYELKIHAKANDAENLLFSIIEIDGNVFFISSDGFDYDMYSFSADDIDLIIGAGQLTENQDVMEDLDLEDTKMGDTFDSYTYNLLGLIDPYGYNKGNYTELSTRYGYKYGDTHSPGEMYADNAINTLPKPIAKELTDIIGSSFMQERAEEFGKEAFFENNPEVEKEFYGFQDELDVQMLKDAGYDELADQLQSNIEEQIISFLDEDYEIRNGASIQTNFDRDPNSIYVYIYTQLIDFAEKDALIEVELGHVYNDLESPEAVRDAVKDFYDNKVPSFKNGTEPAEINRQVGLEESKKPLNENLKFEELLDDVTEYPLHYVEIPTELQDEWVSDLTAYGTPQDQEEVSDYLVNNVSNYLEKLDREAGYVDAAGNPETDEGHFTILDSDFYQELGLFYDSSQYEVYTNIGLYDMYELTPQQYQDVIEAGQIYNESITINKESNTIKEEEEYNPSFEQIDEMIETATEELIYQVGRSFDGYGDPTVEELESGDGAIRFADGGFRSHDSQNINMMYGQFRMPTKEADTKIEELYDTLYSENHGSAVEGLKDTHPDVYVEFSGDPEILTYQELDDAGEAYADVDPERSKMYYDAAEELEQSTNDAFYEDDEAMIFFDVEIQYFTADNTNNDSGQPKLVFRGTVETNYKTLAAKEVTKTFSSEEDLADALAEGTKEIEDWFDGSEYDENEVGINEAMDPNAEDIYDKLSKEADSIIKPIMMNPEKVGDINDDSYSSFSVRESYPVDLMKYLSDELYLPKEFDPMTVSNLEDSIYDAAESEVLGNFDSYIPQDRWQEFIGLEDDLKELYSSGDLEEIDPELYEDIKNWVNEKYADYQADSGVDRSFQVFVDDQEKKIKLDAVITVDPEYNQNTEKKTKVLNFDQVDEAIEFMMDMALWLQGK